MSVIIQNPVAVSDYMDLYTSLIITDKCFLKNEHPFLLCIANKFQCLYKKHRRTTGYVPKEFAVFNERLYVLEMMDETTNSIYYTLNLEPKAVDFKKFIFPIIKFMEVKEEAFIIAISFFEKAAKIFPLFGLTWRWFLLACIMLAVKSYEELTFFNTDFNVIVHSSTAGQYNRRERILLNHLEYRTNISIEEYYQTLTTLEF